MDLETNKNQNELPKTPTTVFLPYEQLSEEDKESWRNGIRHKKQAGNDLTPYEISFDIADREDWDDDPPSKLGGRTYKKPRWMK